MTSISENQETQSQMITSVNEVKQFVGEQRTPVLTKSLLEDQVIPTPSSHSSLIDPHTAISLNDPASGSPSAHLTSNNPVVLSRVHPQGSSLINSGATQKITRLEQLNWLSRTELTDNLHLLSIDQKMFIKSTAIKERDYSNGFEKGNYFQNILPVIASNCMYSGKMSYCCSPRNGPCNKWGLCSKCSFFKGMDSYSMYSPGFSSAHYFFLTCSFDGDIPFGVTNSVLAQNYWSAIRKSIASLIKNNSIDGAYIVHEMSIQSFMPLRVLPHSHIIITATHFNTDLQAELKELITSQRGVDLEPSIKVDLLMDRWALKRTLVYQTKAIDLKDRYEFTWDTVVNGDRSKAILLNLEMKTFLDSYYAAKAHFQMRIRMGDLDSKSKNYSGKSAKAVRAERRRNRTRPQ
ncbi:hypothetical protein [Verrucomicrobium spinosum]|uniref:hypothetical protein n=1 Tax=Verrucomicrobium spinosum TaxID=2736 RepID=UPI000AC7837C|nr:hypothetical protein [Verrucomicrobium spinosum]